MTRKRLTEVVWEDAASGQVNQVVTDSEGAKECMCMQHTYGKIMFRDSERLVLNQGWQENGPVEYTAIPVAWIKEVHHYYPGVPKRASIVEVPGRKK